jgi:hypothetical protein
LAVRFRHFQERVNLTYGWNILWHEGLQLGVEIYLLGLVSLDILEQLLHLGRNLKSSILCRVIGTRHLLTAIFIFFFIVVSLLLSLLSLLTPAELLQLWVLLLLLSLGCGTDMHLIVFLV